MVIDNRAGPAEAPQTTGPASIRRISGRALEIARLDAQVSKDWDEYQKRPRRRFVGARTQEFRFARYIEDWRAKVERVGEMN